MRNGTFFCVTASLGLTENWCREGTFQSALLSVSSEHPHVPVSAGDGPGPGLGLPMKQDCDVSTERGGWAAAKFLETSKNWGWGDLAIPGISRGGQVNVSGSGLLVPRSA